MPPLNYTAADLADLAPEERAALEAAEGGNEELLTELAGGTDTVAGAAGADTAAGAAGADTVAGAAGADTAAGAAGADTVAGAAAEPAAPQDNTVVYRANVGDVAKEIETQKAAIKEARAEKRAALMKMNDGELDAEEYAKIEDAADAKIDAAQDKLLEVNRAATRSEVAAELTQQQQAKAWKGMLDTYVADAKKDGIDYTADATKRGEFNSLLKAFAQEASDKGMTDDDGMAASRWALDEAKKIMAVRYPKAAAAAATAAATTAATAAAAKPAAAAARTGIPPSLGAMPAAAAAPVGDDVMARIATLEGDELELFIASLPKDQAAKLFGAAQ